MSSPLRRSRFSHAVLVALAGMLALPVVQAAAGDPLTPVFDVRSEPGQQQSASAVARAADGSTVIVWRDATVNAIVGRRFAADGSPLDAGFVIATATAMVDLLVAPDVAMDDAGNFVVVWLLSDGRDSRFVELRPSRVQGRRYTADGVSAGALLTPDAENPTATHSVPAVAVDADGDFAVSFRHGFMRSTPERLTVIREESLVQRYRRDGAAAGALISADARTATALDGFIGDFLIAGAALSTFTGSEVDIAMDDDGDFALVWLEQAEAAGGVRVLGRIIAYQDLSIDVVKIRRYAADGTARGPVQRVTTASFIDNVTGRRSSSIFRRPSVAMAANGGHVVSWVERSLNTGVEMINARLFAADGSARSVERAYGEVVNGIAAPDVAVAMNAGGDFVLSWIGRGGVMARLVGADGEPLTDVVTAAERPTFEFQFDSDVAMDREGNVAVSWSRNEGGSTTPNTRLREIVRARLLAGP